MAQKMMNTYERLYRLLEGRTAGEQRGRAHLGRYTHTRDFRQQARAFGAPPHEKPDPGEGTKKDVMTTQAKLGVLRAKEKTATGIQLAQIRKFIARLSGEQSKSANEAQDRYWPGWSSTRRTVSLSSKERKELLKKIKERQAGGVTPVTQKKKQGTFKF